MSISIGMSSLSSSARDTHAAWLRLRADERRIPLPAAEKAAVKQR